MNWDELLGLRLRNQFLSAPCQGPRQAQRLAKSLCGLQAQYFNNALYSVMIRCRAQGLKGWDAGLIKTWTIRGTLHAIPEEDLPIYTALTNKNAYITKYGIDPSLLQDIGDEIMAQLKGKPCGRPELKAHFKDKIADEEMLDKLFSAWGGIFTLLAAQGKIVFDCVAGRNFRAVSCTKTMPRLEAVKAIAERYFRHYGPATIADAVKFLGVKKAELLEALKDIKQISEVNVNNKTHYYLKQAGPVPDIPRISYLTGFDPMLLGYKDHSVILAEEYKRGIITTTGVIKPALLLDGRICGRWAIASGKMQLVLFRSLASSVRQELIETGEGIFRGNFPKLTIQIV